MCTSIIEIAPAEGMAKRGDEWFPLSRAVVAYDHARHAPLGDVITLEPGCYSKALGGVRLEDLVLVTEQGCENLTDFPYDLEL